MASIRDRQSAEYRTVRDELLQAETALKDQRERVAELRRKLAPGTVVETDYVFREGPPDLAIRSESEFFDVRLSQLFRPGTSELIVQHMMFGPSWENGCPACSMWADGFDGIAHHLADRVNFVVVARAPLAKLRDWGLARGWRRLRLLSSLENAFNQDFGSEISDDRQLPGVSVFSRDSEGAIRHFYTSEGSFTESHHRAMDLYNPVWNLYDLLPSGRGDWMPKQFYPSGKIDP